MADDMVNSVGDGARAPEEKRVPVGEAIRYRKRAQEAEAERESLEAALEELRGALASSREALEASERRRVVDGALAALRPADLETARLVLEREIGEGDADEETVREMAAALKKRKPFLFRPSSAPGGAAMGERPRATRDGLEAHARAASETGDRKALMRYLRVRRAEGAAGGSPRINKDTKRKG